MSTPTDYSNTIIYKITCKDDSINGVYVGHTTNFVQRQHCHKQGCVNPKSTNYNCKLYKSIRDHGGWDNWTMEIIAFFKCANQYEARIKEQEYFTLLNANLNSVEPKPKEHDKPSQNSESKSKSSSNRFFCERCDYGCIKKSCWNQHLLTYKHDNPKENLLNIKYACEECNITFKHQSSHSRHKKTCPVTVSNSETNDKNEPTYKELIAMLLKHNTELIEIIKNKE